MGLQDQAATALWRGLKSARVKIRYRRGVIGDNQFVAVDAVRGKTDHDVLDSFGLTHKIVTQDFIVLAATLVIASAVVTPTPSTDSIDLLAADGTTVLDTFVVSHPNGSAPFRWMEPSRTLLRIHTVDPTP